MGINKDLNVDPYYDDFDEAKQFNRVLFKPARAVQARELTQLQTILQKQVERFGSNVYKEGTIISGINLTSRDDISFVKLEDQVGFDDPSLFNEITDEDGRTKRYKVVGKDNGLEAEIVVGLNGFETSAPNLKTFFINYLKSDLVGDTDTEVKEFVRGEQLEIRDWNDTPVAIGDTTNTTVTTFGSGSDGTDHVGKSFGISCEEGVIYQKGHFIFVDKQFIIVTRYSNVPGQSPTDSSVITPVSVGFTVEENIVNSDKDSSLLDNASGFNNYQAPGADRLQLSPKLVSFETASEPEEFFALIRYTDGNATRIRDFTEFSTLGDELARRTYEESGNYVVNGLEASLDKDGTQVEVQIEPGKAYVYGREVTNIVKTNLPVEPVTATQVKPSQKTGVSYGQYFEVAMLDNGTSPSLNWGIGLDLSTGALQSYKLLGNSGSVIVGTCNVINVVPGETANANAKVYVYNIIKQPNQENVAITHIAKDSSTFGSDLANNTLVKVAVVGSDEKLYGSDQACMIFDTGRSGLSSITNGVVVQRKVQRVTLSDGDGGTGNTAIIPAQSNGQPLASSSVVAITTDNTVGTPPKLHKVSTVSQNSNVVGSFTGIDAIFNTATAGDEVDIIYDFALHGAGHDVLTLKSGFVKPNFDVNTNKVSLGVSNVIEIVGVFMANANDVTSPTAGDPQPLTDITSRFRLVNNQKDGVYDHSYLQLIAGEKAPEISNTLLIEFKYLQRTVNGGFITVDSYPESIRKTLPEYTAKNLRTYNLIESVDLRPYVQTDITPSDTQSGAGIPTAISGNQALRAKVGGVGVSAFANDEVFSSTHSYFLSRMDSVVLDEYGNTILVKGAEGEVPKEPNLDKQYVLANVLIPGGSNEIVGENRIRIEEKTVSNYTMQDIEEIENKLNNLTDIVTLSMAERSTKSLIIKGADGVDRFKNGILADTFKDLTGADFTDPEFNSSIDKSKEVAQPAIKEFPIDLKVDENSLVSVSEEFEDITTLSLSDTKTTILNQPYATNVRNCVSNYYNYQGNAVIYPKFVFHRDIIKNPKINITTDLSPTILNLVKNIQKFIPLTRKSSSRRRMVSSFIDRIRRTRGAPTRVTNFIQSTSTTSLTANVKTQTQTLGNFITDFSMKPYLKSHLIRISASGLRPNTEHHFFFSGKNVDAHVRQFRYDWNKYYARKYRRGGRPQGRAFRKGINPRYLPYKNWADFFYGRRRGRGRSSRYSFSTTTVRTDSRGNLFAFFRVPPGKFFVGQNKLEISDVSQYSSIGSGGTSYTCQTHRGYNFSISKSEVSNTTRTVDFNTSTTVVQREFQTRRRDPIAQTFKMRASDTGNANFGYISDINVYFRRKSNEQGVTLQIRESENGYPTSKVLPGASVYLEPSDVNVSSLGTVATKFEFEDPIKLKADHEYCFVIIPDGNSPEYLIYTSKVGNRSLSKGNTAKAVSVTNDWGDGVLFTSTNDSTWKSYQDEDLKFTINRYNFATTGTVDLVPNDVEFLTIRDNKKDTRTQDDDGNALTANATFIDFQDEESVYVEDSGIGSISFTGSMGDNPNDDNATPEIITVSNSILDNLGTGAIVVGDYLLVKEPQSVEDAAAGIAPNKILGRIESITRGTDATEIDLDTPYYEVDSQQAVDCVLVVTGKVELYDPSRPDTLHLTESSARVGNYFDDNATTDFGGFLVGQTYTITSLGTGAGSDVTASWRDVSGDSSLVPEVGTVFVAADVTSSNYSAANGTARLNNQRMIGLASGAEATITSCDSQQISYFQPQIQIDNTPKTSSKIDLYYKSAEAIGGASPEAAVYTLDKPINEGDDIYVTNNPRVIISKSKQIDNLPTGVTSINEDFRFRVTLDNNGFKSVTPTLDDDLTNLNVYEYEINNSPATPASSYISKEVILNPDIPAEGLRVLLSAYRPPGTHIDVYARFINAKDSDAKTDWELLVNKNPQEYSSTNNQEDYREFEYNYTEPATETLYTSFQIKLSMRHSTTAEMNSPVFDGVIISSSLFPHISDYRAVAVS